MGALITLKDIKKSYFNDSLEPPVLHGINFEVKQGEFVALMGPSGSGKSTLMNIIGFLDHLTEGSYHFKKENVSHLNETELANLRSKHIGFIFQTFNLLSNTSVIDNVILPMIYADIPVRERRKRALETIKSVSLDHRIDFLSNQLSGGERQRVAIARALVNSPELILADEPTGNLDTKSGADVLEILQDLHEAGSTIVMVTHESEAAEYAERIVHMRDGLIENDSSVQTRRRGTYNK